MKMRSTLKWLTHGCLSKPLFYSLKQGCSPKLVQLLFETYPSAITMLDFCGETPMSLVYHKNKDPCILKGILEYQPSLASQRIQSFSGPDLVQLVCSPWKNFDTRNAAVIRNHKELSNQWEKVVLTCTAAHKCRHLRSKHDQDTKELHIALELPCSPKILCCFLRMYPEQANMPLPNGMLPLHKYVSSKELLKQTGSSDVIAELIATTPAASSTLYQGNSPLHLAIESGCKWDDGLCQLFYSAPNSLQLLGANSKLFPFMMAATIDPIDLNTVYSLLREGPILIQ